MLILKCFSSFFFPYPTKWGRYNMFSSCCDKDSAIVWPVACLPSTLLGVGTNDCKCSRDKRLNVPSEARRARDINFAHPCDEWPLRMYTKVFIYHICYKPSFWTTQFIKKPRKIPRWVFGTYIHIDKQREATFLYYVMIRINTVYYYIHYCTW
jgi:hypothetical protein